MTSPSPTPRFVTCPACGWAGVKVTKSGKIFKHGRAQTTGARYGKDAVSTGCRGSGLPWNTYVASPSNAFRWARTAAPGDYLVRYDDTGMTSAEDPGSRCGFDDITLDTINSMLNSRGLYLWADDLGLRADDREEG